MPQLIVGPWFYIFTLAWLFFLIITPLVISKYTYLNAQVYTSPQIKTPWTWPWR